MERAETLECWRALGMDAAADDPHNPDRVFHLTAAFVGNRAVEATPATDSASEQGTLRAETGLDIHDVPTSIVDPAGPG